MRKPYTAFITFLVVTLLPLQLLSDTDDRGFKLMRSENRTALVIGNNFYDHSRLTKLKNPVNDARAMKHKLQKLGFNVIYGENLSVREMDRKLDAFTSKLKAGGVGLFFFAGHGVEHKGINYLMGKDSNINDKNDVKYESLPLNKALESMEDARNRLNIVILDACRNDPFSRSSGGGLAKTTARGTFIAYATSPGDVASDGYGNNGVFTSEIIKYIDKPGQPIERLFKTVKVGVINQTGGKQRPWTNSDITGDFFFILPDKTTANAQPKNSPDNSVQSTEDVIWVEVIRSNSIVDYDFYLKEYPNGKYVSVAKYKKRKLENQQGQTKSPSTSSTITHRGITYGTVKSPYTGRVWLDRNLGANRVCTSYSDTQCFGDYYQWGRDDTGFGKGSARNSFDWKNSDSSGRQRERNWMKTDGSGICPKGYRVPTDNELKAETIDQGLKNTRDAYNNFLKLPSAGYRSPDDGIVYGQRGSGDFWSSSPVASDAQSLSFNPVAMDIERQTRASGRSVRCLKN